MAFDFMIPESLNRSALCQNDCGGSPVDGELKNHERIEEPSPRDFLQENLDQEQCEGYPSKWGAHDMKRLLDVVVLECLYNSHGIQRRQVSSETPRNRDTNESHVGHPTYLAK